MLRFDTPVFCGSFREVDEAINEMSRFMKAQVTSRKAAVRSGDGDIDAFTLMVKANEEEGSKYKLNESELVRLSAFPPRNSSD